MSHQTTSGANATTIGGFDVPLLTRDGGYVTTVSVLPMTPLPEIIQWGERFFVRQGDDAGGAHVPAYREAMLWPAIRLDGKPGPAWQEPR